MNLSKSLVLALVAGGVGVCTAQALAQNVRANQYRELQLQPLDVGKKLEPIRVAPARLIDGKAIRIGEWIDYVPGATDQPDTSYFDSYGKLDPATEAPAGFCESDCNANDPERCPTPTTGPSRRWWFGATHVNPFIVGNMTIREGAEGAEAQKARFAWNWGPTTSTQCFVAVFTGETFNECAAGPPGSAGDFDGVVYDFGPQSGGGGYFFAAPDISSMPTLSHEMPEDGVGSYSVFIANAEDPTTGELTPDTTPGTQPMLWGTSNNDSPPDGRFGTQGPLAWRDVNAPFGEHTVGECFDLTQGATICPNPLGFMMMFLGDPISLEPGACCLPDASCEFLSFAECRDAQGLFQGDGVLCNDPGVFCRQPGACCLLDGTCFITAEHVCEGQGGVYQGDTSTCATSPCPTPGACCFNDGSCVVASQQQCSTAGGNYNGDGTLCGPVSCSQEPVLLKNGPLSTGDTSSQLVQAPSGTTWSELQDEAFCAATVFGFQITGANRIADHFIVPGNDGWNIDAIEVFAYQTRPEGATHPPTATPFTGATVRIWDGPPSDPASNVIWGDTTTNRLVTSDFASIYRISRTSTPDQDFRRPIFRNEISIGRHVAPGTYWIDVGLNVAEGAGFAPPVTLIGSYGFDGANALQRNAVGTWQNFRDPGSDPLCTPRNQELAFIILGEEGEPTDCYADCNNDEVLNVDDFTCFINAFASAQALSPQEQIAHYANCDGSTNIPVLTVDDFTCFINEFAQGCP